MLTWATVLAVVVVAFLGWNLYRRFGTGRIGELNEGRRASARFVGRGKFVDGNRQLDVALAVTDSTLFYENSDMEAWIDLQWVREIEYDSELATGVAVVRGKVLRLRTQSQAFEFVVPEEMVAIWSTMLPPGLTMNAAPVSTEMATA